jgi:hypothetical protein
MDDEKLLAMLQTLEGDKCESVLRIIEVMQFTALDLTPFKPNRGVNKFTANLFKVAANWYESSLKIQWTAESRVHTVEFTGKGSITFKQEQFLTQSMPILIARSSTCECGQALQLGNYQVNTAHDDFKFEGVYFCQACKARLATERKGIRKVIARWVSGVKKVQINTRGVNIERE